MTAYYNEIDPFAAQWLRNLIAAGHIAPGEVDDRSILDVSPDDLAGFAQCHFFAGIGVWSYALRLAGWPDDQPAWTGSCPCQPFSVAGVGAGMDDQRHLWPYWFHLIEQRRPAVVFGEQVEAAIRHGWLDLVQADLEGISYAFAAAGIPSASVGAPHIRPRVFFVADSSSPRLEGRHQGAMGQQCPAVERGSSSGELADAMWSGRAERRAVAGIGPATGSSGDSGVADMHSDGRESRGEGCAALGHRQAAEPDSGIGGLGYSDSKPAGRERGSIRGEVAGQDRELGAHDADASGIAGRWSGPLHGFWRNADWLLCRDGKWRPVEPGTFPLAHGATARVGRLRAYGNAICAPLAAEFVSAFMECRP